MNEQYEIKKYVDDILNGKSTKFLDGKMQKEVSKRLKKKDYLIYKPYKDAEKVIFYREKPKVILFEILCKQELKHSDILGSLFALGIDSSLFGDILIVNGHYYIYVLETMKEFFQFHFTMVGKYSITLEEKELSILEDYERTYEEIELLVSSERIDTVLSRLLNMNRNQIKEKMKQKEILFNYEWINQPSKILQEGDIFSIRRYGKYKYKGIIGTTKKGNFVVKCLKYQ